MEMWPVIPRWEFSIRNIKNDRHHMEAGGKYCIEPKL